MNMQVLGSHFNYLFIESRSTKKENQGGQSKNRLRSLVDDNYLAM